MSKSNAHIVLNVRDRTGGQYNAALFNAENQNIIQGDIKNVTVSEVNFPYDIPNIQAGTNLFAMASKAGVVADGSQLLNITIANGFYTGDELITAINDAINVAAAAAAPVIAANDLPLFSYSATSNRVTITPPVAPVDGPQSWQFISPYTFYSVPTTGNVTYNTLGKDIFSIMGFLQTQGSAFTDAVPPSVRNTLYVSNAGYPIPGRIPPNQLPGPVAGAASAPLTFTQYIDICSPQLCKFQYFRDGSTTNLSRRSDVICRLYISNNVAIPNPDPEGTRSFVINRQFYNARRMRWTADNSVGTIDINLYDDVGQPLTTTWQPRPFQITFNAQENPKDEGMMGGMGRAY